MLEPCVFAVPNFYRTAINRNKFWTCVFDDSSTYKSSVTFKLYNISEDYYNYLQYVWQVENGMSGLLEDVGFTDSLIGYSNVSTNAGIVAALTQAEVTIDLNNDLKTLVKNILQ